MPDDARIPMLSERDAIAAAERADLPKAMAPLNIFRVLLHHPPLASAIANLLTTLLFGAKLDARLRELVILRIGWATGSAYEWTQHWRVATGLEIAEQDLLAVRDWRQSTLGPAERAVLQATDETLERGVISPETWRECEKFVRGTEERLELVAAISNWQLISQVLRTLEVPLEAGTAPWPPDGATPSA